MTDDLDPEITERRDRVYREQFPQYAKVHDVLVPHGWEQRYANAWRKKVGRKTATVTCSNDGKLSGNGYLPLLAEAYQLLKQARVIEITE